MSAAFCGVVAFGIYGQAADSRALDAQVGTLTQQNVALQQQIADRQREIVEAQTAAWLEEEARKLGYVFPGEKVFVLTPAGGHAPASGGVNAPLPTFSPLPVPTAAPSATPGVTPRPSPTAVPLTVATPSPSPH